jgi:sarcosine oxidase subunit delta
MLLRCPHCGERDHTEFGYVREAGAAGVSDIDAALGDEALFGHFYLRRNEKGAHREVWQHLYGCRTVFVLERDTLTHELHE